MYNLYCTLRKRDSFSKFKGFDVCRTEEVPADFSGKKILIMNLNKDLTLKQQVQCGRIYDALSMYIHKLDNIM